MLREDLRYFTETMTDLLDIPVMEWTGSDTLRSFGGGEPFLKTDAHAAFLSEIRAVTASETGPFIYCENSAVYYGILLGPDGNRILMGPALHYTMSPEQENTFRAEHELRRDQELHRINMAKCSRLMCLVFYMLFGIKKDSGMIPVYTREGNIADWQSFGEVEEYQLSQSEFDRSHQTGRDFENQLLTLMQRGDAEALNEFFQKEGPELNETGVFAHTPTKAHEYMLVSMITLMTRAAADGGLNPERAYEIGDVYLQQISGSVSQGSNISLIGYRAAVDFTMAVREANDKRSRSSFIEACKGYIESNLRKNIQISEIGPAIGVSRSYLSRRFREEEGMTIQEYIIKRKCLHAANMLRYSDYPIALISEYFCFSSPGYFGKCFRETYNLTPKEYRKKYYISGK